VIGALLVIIFSSALRYIVKEKVPLDEALDLDLL